MSKDPKAGKIGKGFYVKRKTLQPKEPSKEELLKQKNNFLNRSKI